MTEPNDAQVVSALMRMLGKTYCEEAGIPMEEGSDTALFQLFCLSLLASELVNPEIAVDAARELFSRGWTAPQAMCDATWRARADALDAYLEGRNHPRIARHLCEAADQLVYYYGGGLANLRERASHDPHREYDLLLEFKGIGPVGADFFLREVQGVWEEAYPHLDHATRMAASKLGLPEQAGDLARLVDRKDFPRLAAALARVESLCVYDAVQTASGRAR
jgi:hypothetical protein